MNENYRYKGSGEHSVNQLEAMIESANEKIIAQAAQIEGLQNRLCNRELIYQHQVSVLAEMSENSCNLQNENSELKAKVEWYEKTLDEVKDAFANSTTADKQVVENSALQASEASLKSQVDELSKAIELLLPEVYCLMTQLKKPKRLEDLPKESGSVAFAYHTAREALQKAKHDRKDGV